MTTSSPSTPVVQRLLELAEERFPVQEFELAISALSRSLTLDILLELLTLLEVEPVEFFDSVDWLDPVEFEAAAADNVDLRAGNRYWSKLTGLAKTSSN